MENLSFNIRITKELLEEIKKIAKNKGLTASGLIKMVLSEYVEKQNNKNN